MVGLGAAADRLCSPIFSQTPVYPGMIILKLGLYPKLPYVLLGIVRAVLTRGSVPEWESFVKDKQAWEKEIEGTIQYKSKSKGEKMPGSI